MNYAFFVAAALCDLSTCEQLNLDNTCASYSVEIQLWGSGAATVLRDGKRYDVTWHRNGRNDTLTFTDSAGSSISKIFCTPKYQNFPFRFKRFQTKLFYDSITFFNEQYT